MGGKPLLYILSGEDDFSVHGALEEIKKGLGDRDMLSANTTVLDGAQLTTDELQPVCATVPFLAENRLVVVKGLLGRFEPKAGGGGRKKAAAKASRKDECQAFAGCLTETPDSTVVVLVDGKLGGANPLRKALAGKATLKNYPRLRKPELKDWIEKRVKLGGGDISPMAVGLLVSHVGGNLWAMSSEIEKLLLFASGRGIEAEDVEKIVSHAREVNVFAMVDAILEFKARAAEQSLHSLLQRGAAPGYLMGCRCRHAAAAGAAQRVCLSQDPGAGRRALYGADEEALPSPPGDRPVHQDRQVRQRACPHHAGRRAVPPGLTGKPRHFVLPGCSPA